MLMIKGTDTFILKKENIFLKYLYHTIEDTQ